MVAVDDQCAGRARCVGECYGELFLKVSSRTVRCCVEVGGGGGGRLGGC
jgi:hypothetical protein